MWTCCQRLRPPSPERQRRLRASARTTGGLPRHRQASSGRLGRDAARPRGTGHGDGPGLEAGQVAGHTRRSGRQRAGGVRHRAPEPVECRPAGRCLSVPGFPVPRPGTQGRVGTQSPATARGSCVPGLNRSRTGAGTVLPQGKRDVPGLPVISLYREGEHRECSPHSTGWAHEP